MNARFVFPQQPVATPRQPRPQKPANANAPPSRDSNTLRASVLDVALELGIGSNPLVADWMFNNAVQEEDETEEPLSPRNPAPSAFPDSQSSRTLVNGDTNIFHDGTRLSPGTASADADADVDARSTTSSFYSSAMGKGKPVAFPDGIPLPPNIPPIPLLPAPSVHSVGTMSKNKLKKSRKDEYESESGYFSEGGRKSKEKKKKPKAKEGNLDPKDAELLEPEQRKRKRSFVDTVIGRKDRDAGYATDGSSLKNQKSKKGKSKSKPTKDEVAGEVHYETDGGTKMSKTKSFFKLSGKSSKPDLTKHRATTPPVPRLKEQRSLPIAQKFGTTLTSSNKESTPSLDETWSTISHGTSFLPTSFDEPRSTTSLGVSLPSARSSKSTVNEPQNPGNLPSLSFHPLNVAVDVTQPASTSSMSPQRPSSVSLPSSTKSPPIIRDSHSSGSSSIASNPRSRTSASVISAANSNISTSFTSPATSHSNFQLPSPHTGHGLGTGSSSTTANVPQHGHGHGYGQTQRMDPFPRPTAASRSTSPPSSAASAAAVAGMMSFQISRDVSTVPLMLRHQQQEQQEHGPVAQIQDDGQAPSQIQQGVESELIETYMKRTSAGLPPIAPLNISKGGGLRLKPSLEKINLFGMRKDTREPVSAGGATPSSVPSPPPATTAPLKSSLSTTSLNSAGPHSLLVSPTHSLPLQSGRSRDGRPLSPPRNPSSGRQTFSPHPLISQPNTATTQPTNSPLPSRSSSRPRFSLNPPPPIGTQLVAPNVLAYYDIPPPSPPPVGPLPIPPPFPGDGPRSTSPMPSRNHSRSPVPPLPTNHHPTLDGGQFPSPAQLRQRMLDRTPRKLPTDEALHGGLAPPIVGAVPGANIRRGKESPFPSAPIFQRATPAGVSSSGASDESADSGDGSRNQYEIPPRSPIQPGPLNNQEKRVLDSVLSRKHQKRSSWINFGDALANSDVSEEEDVNNRNDEYEVRDSLDDGSLPKARDVFDRLPSGASRSEESAYSSKELSRSRSSEGVVKPDLPSHHHHGYAWDDSMTTGDRTSRWSGSIYSRMSIMDEDESNDVRDRFVKRVEAMLADGGRKDAGGGGEIESGAVVGVASQISSPRAGGRGRDQYIPPVPKIPDAFVGSIRRSEAVPPGRSMWNKF